MVSDPKHSAIVEWTEDGAAFIVKDREKFTKDLLSLFFRHSSWTSFMRQTQLYGFRYHKKEREDGSLHSIFQHPLFHRDHYYLLSDITRRAPSEGKGPKQLVSELKATTAKVGRQAHELWKSQDYVLSVLESIFPIPPYSSVPADSSKTDSLLSLLSLDMADPIPVSSSVNKMGGFAENTTEAPPLPASVMLEPPACPPHTCGRKEGDSMDPDAGPIIGDLPLWDDGCYAFDESHVMDLDA